MRKPPGVPERLGRGVIFVLGVQGHKNAGFSDKEAHLQFRLSRKYADNFRQQYKDPFEIRTFNSLSELVRNKASGVNKWTFIMLVTHGSAAGPHMPNLIFTGDKEYSSLEIQEFVDQHRKQVKVFREQFAKDSSLVVIACGPAAHNAELGIYLREFFAVEGGILLPKINVDFTSDGVLGTPLLDEQGIQVVVKGKPRLRAIRDDEWLTVSPIPQEFRRE